MKMQINGEQIKSYKEAILLYTTVAVGPRPPEVENTRGEKQPCLTSRTLCSFDVTLSKGCVCIRFRKGIEHLNIKKGLLPVLGPKNFCSLF